MPIGSVFLQKNEAGRSIQVSLLWRMVRAHRSFVVLLSLFILTCVLEQITLPPMEGVDETLHLNYVVRLRSDGLMPDRASNHTNGTRQESGQPPLTYWVMATFLNLIGVPSHTQDPLFELDSVRNLWYTPIDPWRRIDNENVYLDGPAGDLMNYPAVANLDRLARVVSLFFGVISLCGAYAAMREVFDQPQWILLGTALFAFTPTLIQISADVSNDGGAVAFATLAIWQTLRLLKKGATAGRLILIGILLGLTGLSKLNALLVGPGVIVVLLIDWRMHHKLIKRLITNALLVAVPFGLLFGPWVLYGWVNYHSAFGLEGHSELFADPNHVLPTPGAFIASLGDFLLTYLGKMGAGGIRFDPLVYLLLTVITIASALGYGFWLLSRPKIDWRGVGTQQSLVLIVIAGTMTTGIFYWLITLFAINESIQGRLIYPAHTVFVMLLTGGLYFLCQRLPTRGNKPLRLYVVTLPIVASLILSPIIQIAGYAQPQRLTTAQLPLLQGQPFDFDHTIRFLGYHPSSPIVHANIITTFTLCWQVLRLPTHEAAFSLKLFDANGTAYGDRTSVHGLGHYPAALWRVGDLFCDDVDMLVIAALPSNKIFNLLVVLIDPHTMAADWTATTPGNSTPVQYPIIGQIQS